MKALDLIYEQAARARDKATRPMKVGKMLRGTNISLSLGLVDRLDLYDEHANKGDIVFPVHKGHLRG